uniref:Uncharacterized protein n=1 Tax=Aegilops tauschii subsp. strangulata TaxID=200361 RepID=A0A453BE69_AEGTS
MALMFLNVAYISSQKKNFFLRKSIFTLGSTYSCVPKMDFTNVNKMKKIDVFHCHTQMLPANMVGKNLSILTCARKTSRSPNVTLNFVFSPTKHC